MRERLWDNPDVRRTTLTVIATVVVVCLLVLTLWYAAMTRLQNKQLERDWAIIGRLTAAHPEWANPAADFTRPITPAESEAGRLAASQYGFDEPLPLVSDRPALLLLRQGAVGVAGAGLLLSGLLAAIVTRAYRRMYRMVDRYTELAGRIVEGDFSGKTEYAEEGAFAKLAHQFQQMSNRLQLTLERLEEEKQAMKRLLTDVSHQLKTPLASLRLFNELLQDGDADDPEKRRQFLDKSESLIDKMEWLIRQLLTVARLEAGAARMNREPLPVKATVDAAVRLLEAQAREKRIELNVSERSEPDGCLRLLLHDPAWLEEAVTNIVRNGIEHTQEGGRIEVSIEFSPVLCRISVKDNGAGIPPEDLPYVFDRFYKGRNRAPGSGTGIGLSLARAIALQHDGLVGVRSAPGHGTTVTMTFPLH